jgi:phosphoenolpyruvate carboxykinase (GTP)
MTRPKNIVWCDGSEEEAARMQDQMIRQGDTLRLNEKTYPNCILHRSDPSDVARTEQVTFICTRDRRNAGPTNNWMSPDEAKQTLGGLFKGSMKDRTMFVIPYSMGPAGSPQSRIGVEISDSPYVVASMRIMSRIGKMAMDRLGNSNDFVPGLHSLGDLNPSRRYIAHFPEEKLIWSVGSGYGGNALLGKK